MYETELEIVDFEILELGEKIFSTLPLKQKNNRRAKEEYLMIIFR